MPIQVAVNRKYTEKIGRDHPERWRYNNTFEDVDLPDAKSLARLVYQGYPFCPQHKHVHNEYVAKDGATKRTSYRCQQNFTGTNILSVDLDDETDRCSIPSLLLNPFVISYSSFLYPTVSSRPDAPRTRIVFEAENYILDVDYYRLSLKALIGLFRSDDSCSDVMKIYAGSPRCQVAFVERTLPASVLDNLVAQEKQRYVPRIRSGVENEVENANVTKERVRDALRAIPGQEQSNGGLDYSEWRKVVAAIHSQWPGDDGVDMVLSWSPDTPAKEVEKMFKSYGNHSGREAKIGSIIRIAKQFGWQDTLRFRDEQQKSDYIIARLLGRAL